VKDLGKLRAANEGDHRAFQHVLDVAYGRKGKLVHELMEPFLITPKSEIPPPMIQGLERSRPPVYSQAFRALLTNPLSRKTKALTLEKIDKPPKLPSRADPDSEDARLLGPLSKRRHVNILWRAYTHEVKYTIPPLDVKLSQQGHSNGENKLDIPSSPSGTASNSMSFGVTLGGFQDAGMVERLRLMAGLGGGNRAMTRRERRALSGPEVSDASLHPSLLPTRQLRRSHRWLLSKIPLLKCVPHKDDPTVKNRKTSYSVYLANEALRNSRFKARQKISPVDHSWIVYGETTRRRRHNSASTANASGQTNGGEAR